MFIAARVRSSANVEARVPPFWAACRGTDYDAGRETTHALSYRSSPPSHSSEGNR